MSKKQRQREEPIVGEASGAEMQITTKAEHPTYVENTDFITTAGPKVLIAVPSCEADRELVSACKATWAESVNNLCDIVFFTGEVLGVPDNYEDLPIKVQAICKWALLRNYDFMLKVDSDTYVWLDRILASGFEQHDYSGWTGGKAAAKDEYASGGAGYWLSKRAMQIVAEASLTSDTCEDRWVGRVLYDAGIIVHRNVHHAHGRHEEVTPELLTMHPCRSLEWMKKMQES
jgi:hypothetical protein